MKKTNNPAHISNLITLLNRMIRDFDGSSYLKTETFNERWEDKIKIDVIWEDKAFENKWELEIKKEYTLFDLRFIISELYKVKPCNIMIIAAKWDYISELSHIELWSKLSLYKNFTVTHVWLRTFEQKQFELPSYIAAENMEV